MKRRYFEIVDDVELPGRWFLNGLYDTSRRELDSRDFTYGRPLTLQPQLRVSLWSDDESVDVTWPLYVAKRREGNPLSFTYADSDMPVVTEAIANVLSHVAGKDLQRFPVQVEDSSERFEIINVTSLMTCLDTNRSEVEWWTDADFRPDKAGKARLVTRLVIDPQQVGDHHIFRPAEWDLVIIVSDVLKAAFEGQNVSGVRFREV